MERQRIDTALAVGGMNDNPYRFAKKSPVMPEDALTEMSDN